jgi:hypothetical protein
LLSSEVDQIFWKLQKRRVPFKLLKIAQFVFAISPRNANVEPSGQTRGTSWLLSVKAFFCSVQFERNIL